MDDKHDVETAQVESVGRRGSATGSQKRRGSVTASIEDAFTTSGRRASAHNIDYVDHREGDDRAEAAKGRDSENFDGKYWYSANFIGTLLAIGFSFMAGIGGYGLIAPVLGDINKDIGPSPNIYWVPLVNLCGGCVFFLLVGRLSDIFGRRWFFIAGSVISLIGTIIGSQAKNVNTLIGAQVFIGIAASCQLSFFWIVAEVVPMKWRYIANGYTYFMTTPTSPLASIVAFAMQNTKGQWRNSFYMLTGMNVVSILLFYFFYHPPSFNLLHQRMTAKELFFGFDWVGVILFIGSLCIFIFGLNWGGTLYPWTSVNVIATMVIGGVVLFFILPAYEIWISRKGREPYLPIHLFTNIRFMAAAWNTGIGACVYYGAAIVFPQVVQTLYYAEGKISKSDIGVYAGLLNMAFVFAQSVHGFIVAATRGPKWAMIGAAIIAAPLLSAAAANLDNKDQTCALLFIGAFAMGVVESVSITTSTFPLRSQEEIGQGGGLSGSIRNFTSAIAIAVYVSTLNNRLATTIPKNVDPVALKMGLPASSLPALIAAVSGTGDYSAVKGLTPAIQAAVQPAYRLAFKQAASTVFLVILAFSGPAIILACFTQNNDPATEHYVAGNLHAQQDDQHEQVRKASISDEKS